MSCLLDIGFPLLLAVGISFWLSATGFDLEWQRASFSADTGDWSKGDSGLWKWLYAYGAVPVLVVCGASVLVLVAGLRWGKWRAWRRIAWYFIALLVVGSGLITNLWLKDTWGRPRPREITEFGGRSEFEDVFAMDLTGEGKSFPSGHATVGFFFVGLWFLLRRRYPIGGLLSMAAALFSGGLIGYARMLQGGHFATDVVWSAAVMWGSAAIFYYALGLDRSLLEPPLTTEADGRQKVPLWSKVAGGLALAALLAGVSMGTPYKAEREIHPLEAVASTARINGSVSIWLGDVVILPESSFQIVGQAWGHGLPTSEIADHWEEMVDAVGIWHFKYHQRNSGWLKEVWQNLELGIPWSRADSVKFDLGPGRARLRLPEVSEPVRIELVVRDTELSIELERGATLWMNPDSFAEPVEGMVEKGGTATRQANYLISVTAREGGRIQVTRVGDPALE